MSEPDVTGAYQPAPPPPPGERFAPGALLANRYRIVAPLGKGGMGEVYRADDLTLAQPVALKFLPVHIANDPDRLARFRKEVAAARRVSHPNVCRVYDIVEHGGQSFLTMEFTDGEDLSSVLKRLGRVPEEKGIEIARQLCSALAAVHDEGLLHRDLKPANVMIDGRGKVRLTDFGLAATAEDLSVSEMRSGTPLYQAPEQLSGKEVTVRSDLFALGLVLYEVFTGKRAFPDQKRDAPPSKPSSHVTNLNPAVEAVILKCLEPDPNERPRSAPEVLAALPGGDPLGAALAAGQTPSPQMVADAGEAGHIRPWVGAALLGTVVLFLSLSLWIADRLGPARRIDFSNSPTEMAKKARRVLTDLGYTEEPVDRVGWYEWNGAWAIELAKTDPHWTRHLDRRPGAAVFVYRESPSALAPGMLGPPGWTGADNTALTRENPPPQPGMADVVLDPAGRLMELSVTPPRRVERKQVPAADWYLPLFTAAGLDFKQFHPTAPEWAARGATDQRLAWLGTWPDQPERAIRVEVAEFNGKPVYFQIIDVPDPGGAESAPPFFVGAILANFLIALNVLCVIVAVRNIRRGRADLPGAFRLVVVVGGLNALYWLVDAHHSGSGVAELSTMASYLGAATYGMLLCGFSYLAIEPFFRRKWPRLLSSWMRLLAGRWRDPLVGRDVLIGIAAGCSVPAFWHAALPLCELLGLPAPGTVGLGFASPSTDVGYLALGSIRAIKSPPSHLFMAYVMYLIFRRPALVWIAYFLWFSALFASFHLTTGGSAVVALVVIAIENGIYTLLLARFGLLALAACWFAENLSFVALTVDPGRWYFWSSIAGVAIVAGIAVGAFYTATGGQGLFKEGFFGDD